MTKSIAVIMVAILALGSLALIPSFASADTTDYSRTWIRLHGFINKWDNESAFGWLRAMAKIANINGTVHEWAVVNAMWSLEQQRLNVTDDHVGTFTFSFYRAVLSNTSMIALNYSGYDLYVAGLWNVSEFTTTLTIDATAMLVNFTRTITPVVTLAPGDLHVKGLQFGLDITGIAPLSGYVWMALIQFKEIKFFDMNGDGKVDIKDLVHVAKRYGAVTGMKNYDFNVDFNCEGRVSIDDLTTVAANIEV